VVTEEDKFRQRWREWGLTEKQLDCKWAEYLDVCGEQWRLEKKGLKPEEVQNRIREYESRLKRNRTWL